MSRLDRYLIRIFLERFVVVLAFVCAVHLAIDLADSTGHLFPSGTPLFAVMGFVLRRIPVALARLIPVATLVAMLSSLSRLGRRGELGALYSAGVSNARIAVPFMAASVGCAVFLSILSNYVVPHGQVVRDMDRGTVRSGGLDSALWHVSEGTIWRATPSATRDRLGALDVLRLDEEGRITSHTRAARAVWSGGQWIAPVAQVWRLSGPGGIVFDAARDVALPLPRVVESVTRLTVAYETLTYGELSALVETARPTSRSGYALRLALALRWLLPSSCIFLVFAGLPLGLWRLAGGDTVPLEVALLVLAGFAVTALVGSLWIALAPDMSPLVAMGLPQTIWPGVGLVAFRRLERGVVP